MRYRDGRRFVLAAMLTVLGGVTAIAADKPAVDAGRGEQSLRGAQDV